MGATTRPTSPVFLSDQETASAGIRYVAEVDAHFFCGMASGQAYDSVLVALTAVGVVLSYIRNPKEHAQICCGQAGGDQWA